MPIAGGCVPRPPCKPGEARDANDPKGACVPAGRVRALAEENGIYLGDDDDVGCERGEELILSDASGHLRCSPPPPAMRACPIGAVGDEAASACVKIKEGNIVDAALWLRSVVGPAGGRGSRAICRALGAHAVDDRGEAEIVFRFVDNDVSQLELRARPMTAEVALEPFANAARGLGGAARTSEVATRVWCGQVATTPPRPKPREAH